jgi:hypothetical protein
MMAMKYLEKSLDSIHNIINQKDYDWIHVIEGPEGVGKTSLAWSMCKRIDPKFDGEKNSIFNHEQLLEIVKNSYPGMAVNIDEGALVFFSRDTMSNTNKASIKLMTGIRTFNLFITIPIPQFQLLDKYIREHRVKSASRIPIRGWAWFYCKRTLNLIRPDKKRRGRIIWPDWDFRDTFPDAAALWPEEWERYKKKKMKNLVSKGVARQAEEGENVHQYECWLCHYVWDYGGRKIVATCPICHRSSGRVVIEQAAAIPKTDF